MTTKTDHFLSEAQARRPNGAIIYQGPSMLDGAPIVVIATGLNDKSRNAKTGSMVQTWILRADVDPQSAANSGADKSICGDCPLRGSIVNGKNVDRACYVSLFQAPRSVYASFKRGIYPVLTTDEARHLFEGRHVRLGAYGDPAAAPFDMWEHVLSHVAGVTGYTHAWRKVTDQFKRFVMASCDTPADRATAIALGYRTFRVRTSAEIKDKKEVVCPASHEAGQKTSCADCLACGGLSSKAKASITILAHGARASAFARLENRNAYQEA